MNGLHSIAKFTSGHGFPFPIIHEPGHSMHYCRKTEDQLYLGYGKTWCTKRDVSYSFFLVIPRLKNARVQLANEYFFISSWYTYENLGMKSNLALVVFS